MDNEEWTRTISAATDFKFILTRLDDEIGMVDQRMRFNTERSAYVRKIDYRPDCGGKTGRARSCTLVTPDRVAVDSNVKDADGVEIVTYHDIVAAQMMSYNDKVDWFQNTCKQLTCPRRGIMLQVRRDSLLEDSINLVMGLTPTELRKH